MINRGECEAIRRLRDIVDAPAASYERNTALKAAVKFLKSLKLPAGESQMGRPAGVTKETLLEISRLDAEGQNVKQIADLTGVSRSRVYNHLRPSPAMIAACTGETPTSPDGEAVMH